ncbi:MAG: hypothetical protein II712_02555, partial [Erysipelotrichaceae bacterium]|nr:hypothetical protein [Erysipelotrichaceae bacterium]
MGLFSFLKKDKKEVKPEVRPAAAPAPKPAEKPKTSTYLTESEVRQITDQDRLWEIIRGKYGWDITKTAASRIKDQAPLMDYMKTLTAYSDQQKRAAISNGITDQKLLAQIASKDKEFRLRQSALRRLTDKAVIRNALLEYYYSSTEVGDMLKKVNKDELGFIIENSKISSTVEY